MSSPTYSTAHPWEDLPGRAIAQCGSKDTVAEDDVNVPDRQLTPSQAPTSALQAFAGPCASASGSASAATTRCGTPFTRATTPQPGVELGGRGRPDFRAASKHPTVDVKSRFCTSTASLRLNQTFVNLRALAKYIPGGNCVYMADSRSKVARSGPDMAKLLMPIGRAGKGKSRYVHIQIFKNGYVCIIGAKSYREVVRTATRLVEKIKRSNGT